MVIRIGQIHILLCTEQLSLQASFPKHISRKIGRKKQNQPTNKNNKKTKQINNDDKKTPKKQPTEKLTPWHFT